MHLAASSYSATLPNPCSSIILPTGFLTLRRRQHLEGLSDLGYPTGTILSVDLGGGFEILGSIEQGGANDIIGSHDLLVVIRMGGAIGTVVAVDRFARITLVDVFFQFALGHLNIVLVHDLVERGLGPGELLTGVAVTVRRERGLVCTVHTRLVDLFVHCC